MYFIVFLLLIIIISIQFTNYNSRKQMERYSISAKAGVIDLSHWDLNTHPIISLDGEWEFFHGLFLESHNSSIQANGYITVPGLWSSFKYNGESIAPATYGSYRLRVILPENQNKSLSLKIPDMSSSYSLYVDGKEISSNGVVGKSYEEESPCWKPLVKSIGAKSREMDIIVQVSNFHHIKGGIWESILLGTEEAVNKNRELNLMISFLLIGILFISALYYLIIYSVMKINKASLYLALFCIAAGLRELLIREVVAILVFPSITFNVISKLEYMTVPLGPILLALSIYGLYPTVFPKKALIAIILPFIIYIVIILFTPLSFFANFMNPCLILFVIAFMFIIKVIVMAARKKKPGADLLLFGTIILLITAIIDMGYFSALHYDYNLAYTFSFGLIIFILCQMHSLTLIIADIFDRSQKLSKAELAFLQAQIVPHFLYNTLNTIIYLTRESPKKARDLLLKLSQYLRGKFDFEAYNQNSFVSLEYELGIVESYLSIELVRFNERLKVIYDIDQKTLKYDILPFTIQPLVENAILHGLKNKAKEGKIIISSYIEENYLLISIEDNGIGMSKEKILSIIKDESIEGGTGLYNVHARLKKVYGEGLRIASSMNKGTTITMKIPLRREKGYVKGYAN